MFSTDNQLACREGIPGEVYMEVSSTLCSSIYRFVKMCLFEQLLRAVAMNMAKDLFLYRNL